METAQTGSHGMAARAGEDTGTVTAGEDVDITNDLMTDTFPNPAAGKPQAKLQWRTTQAANTGAFGRLSCS